EWYQQMVTIWLFRWSHSPPILGFIKMRSVVRYEDAVHRMGAQCYAGSAATALRLLSRFYDHALSSSGILLAQLELLVAVAHGRRAPMAAAARALDMDPKTIARHLKPLELAGLLRVGRSRADAGVRFVFLTPAGERKMKQALPLLERAEKTIRVELGETHASDLRTLLRKLVDSFSELELPMPPQRAPRR